jgi:molybdate transport system ATP-binding protein
MPFRQIIIKSRKGVAVRLTRCVRLNSTCTTEVVDENSSAQHAIIPPLVRFEAARLQYPSHATSSFDHGLHDDMNGIKDTTFDLNIFPNLECGSGGGGHVILGKNGSGKTSLSQTLINYYNNNNKQSYLQSGSIVINKTRDDTINRNNKWLTHVSFESHSELLMKENTTTVHRALIPGGGNRLSPTAKFLAVRLGMYPLLSRYVNTLSTGEIRRVLLVRALVSKPELLLLDNSFDGLDVSGRQGLTDIIERVLNGFRMDILVQGVGDAKDTARTQIMLFSHRPEEISAGFGMVTYLGMGRDGNNNISTEQRFGRSACELVTPLMVTSSSPDIPSKAEIMQFWQQGKITQTNNNDVLVEAKSLQVTRDDTTLISNLDWVVQRGERWHLGGTNGAGKSTLSRLLLRISVSNNSTEWVCNTSGRDAKVQGGMLNVTSSCNHAKRGGVALVSTELHLHAAQNWGKMTIREVLTKGASFLFDADKRPEHSSNDKNISALVDDDIAITAAKWLGLVKKDQPDNSILHREFSTLSQGQQKLLLIASAIALRPSLLVLDEPCQGLDLCNRELTLSLIEEICQTTDMSLIYITHHNEELVPSINRRLVLEDGKAVYCGVR